MTLDKAYQRLGLVQLDRFLAGQLTANRARYALATIDRSRSLNSQEVYRQLGATTWMCVRAAMALEETNVLLVGNHGAHQARTMVDRTARFAETLHGIEVTHDYSNQMVYSSAQHKLEMSNMAELRWTTCHIGERVSGATGFRGLVFNDWLWAERMKRRANGPFAMVREIRLEKDESGLLMLSAYAEDNEYLMELTFDGTCALLTQEPTIRCVGFKPETLREVWD